MSGAIPVYSIQRLRCLDATDEGIDGHTHRQEECGRHNMHTSPTRVRPYPSPGG